MTENASLSAQQQNRLCVSGYHNVISAFCEDWVTWVVVGGLW